ncbi:MAG: hypothetical protein K0S07_65 [Chlamydiales bacterium]|jgi:SNF2 family DNA or RNA helicase|nr:hypothetical protein [Chlamydiales bacterium]
MSLLKSGKMLNFRKLRQDFATAVLREGKAAFENGMVLSAKIINLSKDNIRLSSRVQGKHDNSYECEIEIDRHESDIIDSNCDCTYQYDCSHLAAVLSYLEKNFDAIIVAFSKENDLEKFDGVDEKDRTQLREAFKAAESKEIERKGKEIEKQLLDEYILSAKVLGASPFFRPLTKWPVDKAEIALILLGDPKKGAEEERFQEISVALRLPYRSKPLNIPNLKLFVESLRYLEPINISGKNYFFCLESFDLCGQAIVKMLIDFALFHDSNQEKAQKQAWIKVDRLGSLLAETAEMSTSGAIKAVVDEKGQLLPSLYIGSLEQPLYVSRSHLRFRFELEYLEAFSPKIMLKPLLMLDAEVSIALEQACFFDGAMPGLIYQNTYWHFEEKIQRRHLQALQAIRDLTIPEPLFGTFIENALPELLHFADVVNKEKLEQFVTLPFVDTLKAICDIQYLNGEMEAAIHFLYGDLKIPSAFSQLKAAHLYKFNRQEGILARNLIEEQSILLDLFQDFYYSEEMGGYICKSDKKIVEFMTEVIPRNQHRVTFNCPENLLDQFIYDSTSFSLSLKESSLVDCYQVTLKVDGDLKGVSTDLLWDCITSRRAFIELQKKNGSKKADKNAPKIQKILVLDLEKLSPIVQLFDEIGIAIFSDHAEDRPLWTLTSIQPEQFENLPISFQISKKLLRIQEQMLGKGVLEASPLPKEVKADLRSYQTEGVHWLERLRSMHLNGILADDMGLGKTLQAITAVTQYIQQSEEKKPALVVCPTSLIYNWKEEFTKFNNQLVALPIDGTPQQRRKQLEGLKGADVVITSYTLLQKDIETYKNIPFGYAILDEAQHIKNRGTRNAKSVKMIQAAHRLILTGTPLENSLEDIWSLFDFLMPGLLSSFDRFIEKYIRNPNYPTGKSLEVLRRKLSPFILRRMKADVLDELPAVSHILYHCHLSNTQKELYRSYADSAREELSRLVSKEGFERIQIHVLATLTRLKQICCHPAIFAKEKAEPGDSAKYDMLIELLQSLIESNHKTVIFSQYTRMLSIMREDLEQLGIRFSYLDGSSKNRMGIVKQFNEDPTISVFLVSLKAGGAGLNLVGADTVIHYDLWWNPAVENQATDRVHRLGQKRSVSSYKLITMGTIEEKILELQQRKKGLVKEIISCDEEAMAKLTWEEVLELLQT